ncbi:MAG: alpha/beta hydrolase fold domain-containing protein [Armatimonadia bacterium]|nr:alpha/beta hydrolase fold domain-containing protein [Armatimonadia bacterium]
MTDHSEQAQTAFTNERANWRGANLQVPDNVEVRMNVPYSAGEDFELTTDLFVPDDSFDRPRPALLFVHGGGWQGGSPTQFYRQASMLAEKGIVGSCCRYRFSADYKFPASVHDVKAAVRWLRANADDLNIDPDRIGTTGGSAGGHLAAMLATTAGVAELEGEGGSPGHSSAVQLAVLLNPITDMTVFVSDTNLHPAAVKYMGGTPEEKPHAYELASPILHIDEATPPCYLLHGTADATVPYDQSTRFAGAMQGMGLKAEVVLVEGVPHGFFNSSPHFEATWPGIEAFVTSVFGL